MPSLIRDIVISTEFIKDFDAAPKAVRQAVDKFIDLISQSGCFPNSLNVHKLDKLDLWTGYITVVRGHWRVLFTMNQDKSITFHRLMAHDKYSHYLRELVG